MGRLRSAKSGDIFGRWTVIDTYVKGGKYLYAKCRCSCGVLGEVRGASLKSRESKSCGCLAAELSSERAKTHGNSCHELWGVYSDMMRRCYDTTRKDYKHYGGRGITVSDRWKEFSNFVMDMHPRPDGLELDRIDVNGNYCKENCRWATRTQQMRNTRYNTVISFNGESMCLSEWAEATGIPLRILIDRLGKLQWRIEEALTTPPIRARKGIKHGQFKVKS